jgi:hypothetical protein
MVALITTRVQQSMTELRSAETGYCFVMRAFHDLVMSKWGHAYVLRGAHIALLFMSHPFPQTVGTKTKTKLRGRSPQANYTDRATAACRRSREQREICKCHSLNKNNAIQVRGAGHNAANATVLLPSLQKQTAVWGSSCTSEIPAWYQSHFRNSQIQRLIVTEEQTFLVHFISECSRQRCIIVFIN